MPFKFIDLFAGIGGFRCGMTAAGGECVFTSEWDKYAAKTYQAWYGDDHIYTGDIREIDIALGIPDHDVLCAGFPCQPFSLAGVSKKNSLGRAHGFEDAKQGNLFFKIMDIVDIKRPPVLVLENVKNLKGHDKGNTWKVIEESIRERDYAIYSKVLDARHWVPQHRERIFIVCFDKSVFGREDQIQFQMPTPDTTNNPTLSSILGESPPDKKYMLSDKLWQYLVDYAAKHKAKGNGFGYGLNTGKDVSRTMSARYHKDGAEILIKQKGWRNPRRLTPQEAMLLLGYSAKYSELFGHESGFPQVVSDTQAYRQFGNSVVPGIVEEVAHEVVRCMAEVIQRAGNGCLLKSRNVSTY
jgi:DNA (cytosine-5)-methyltransferase 1